MEQCSTTSPIVGSKSWLQVPKALRYEGMINTVPEYPVSKFAIHAAKDTQSERRIIAPVESDVEVSGGRASRVGTVSRLCPESEARGIVLSVSNERRILVLCMVPALAFCFSWVYIANPTSRGSPARSHAIGMLDITSSIIKNAGHGGGQ